MKPKKLISSDSLIKKDEEPSLIDLFMNFLINLLIILVACGVYVPPVFPVVLRWVCCGLLALAVSIAA